jgi:hypothetical protein
VLLKDKQPDPALPVRGGFEDKQGHVGDAGPDLEERRKQLEAVKASKSESAVGLLNPNLAGYEAAMNVSPIYAGLYRMKLSLWGFQWNAGKPEPWDRIRLPCCERMRKASNRKAVACCEPSPRRR